jgi:hypothetical protein
MALLAVVLLACASVVPGTVVGYVVALSVMTAPMIKPDVDKA